VLFYHIFEVPVKHHVDTGEEGVGVPTGRARAYSLFSTIHCLAWVRLWNTLTSKGSS
jgi:hypothetical protein